MKAMILYHANCPDGFCAAWAASLRFGDGAEYVPVQYGQDPPDVSGADVYIVDFSYKRDVMRRIMSSARFVCVLDHHKTAASELAGIVDEFVLRPDLIANPPGSELPLVRLDMNKSGGRLAWEYFHPDRPPPWLVEYTEDRDLWRWALPDSRDINAGLAAYPRDFAAWSDLADADADAMRRDGIAINRYMDGLVDSICRGAREVDLAGHRIFVANTSVLFSEVAGRLAEGRPFGAAWFQRADGQLQWSLRSTPDGVDVSEIARSFGGGGHRHAAGFQTPGPEGDSAS